MLNNTLKARGLASNVETSTGLQEQHATRVDVVPQDQDLPNLTLLLLLPHHLCPLQFFLLLQFLLLLHLPLLERNHNTLTARGRVQNAGTLIGPHERIVMHENVVHHEKILYKEKELITVAISH
jgi:hypothetical protein